MVAEQDDDGPEDDDGVVASHELEPRLSLLVAPSTESQHNTFNPPLIPVACTRLNDARFEFDSSIVRPKVAREMRKLSTLWDSDRFKRSRASVFGHADPTGSDDYNKVLSGRRASAIYALLTRNVELWEKLHTQPLGNDNWAPRAVQVMLGTVVDPTGAPYLAQPASGVMDAATRDAVRRFQGDNGLASDGDPGPQTRRVLFPAYMDAVCRKRDGSPFQVAPDSFLARGSDPDGKGDYQGCSEFNPVRVFSQAQTAAFTAQADKTERDQQNEVNRRVMIFLFRPGLSVEPGRWPCPRVKEGVADCRKQFWPDGDQRRAPQAAQRDYADSPDTFACAFYDTMAHRSPCEGVVIVQAVRIRLFDRLSVAIARAPFRIMSGQEPERGVADAHGFITVRDVSAPATVTVRWRLPDDVRAAQGQSAAAPDDFDFEMDVFVDIERRSDLERVRMRLTNLGYTTEPTLSGNVRRFQHDYKLPENGDPTDANMQAVLKERHDNFDPEPVPPGKPMDMSGR